ncbi:hypothetical protein V8G54_009928 [Vigna mungo]|uniref:S-acyltransferase n=1 Tax=Vigna mungo TaxID=3915 RepID=A0AAQ3NUV7_VIGMU
MHRSGATMAWNVFKFCTALRGLGSIMILLVLGVVGVTYYAVVLTNFGPALSAGGLDSLVAVLVLILFHSLLVMLLWSYFSVVFTDPGSVPPNWRPTIDEERGEADPLVGTEFSNVQADPNQRIRYCRKCNQLKPPRCHHCSVCAFYCLQKWALCFEDGPPLCVGSKLCWSSKLQVFPSLLGMDALAGVIVSLLSVQFYTFLETTLVTASLLPHFIAFFSDGEIPGTPGSLATTFLAFVLNLAFALSVLGFLIMHISLVAANTTTIEAYEKKTTPKWRYDLGRRKNFEQDGSSIKDREGGKSHPRIQDIGVSSKPNIRKPVGGVFLDKVAGLCKKDKKVGRSPFCLGFLEWTRSTGSFLHIQMRISERCQLYKVLTILQNLTLIPNSSKS